MIVFDAVASISAANLSNVYVVESSIRTSYPILVLVILS